MLTLGIAFALFHFGFRPGEGLKESEVTSGKRLEAEAPASGEAVSAVLAAANSKAALESRLLESFELGWQERFPEGRAVDRRLKSLPGNRYRLQSLVETGRESLPWVLWEEKLALGPDGSLQHFGAAAHVGNAFIVEVKEGLVDRAQLDAFVEEFGMFVERRSRLTDYWVLGFKEVELGRLEALVAEFGRRFPGALAEFDSLSFTTSTPNDWDASRMWGLEKIRARDAWTFERGNSNTDVVVAIIDTGVQRNHFDIVDNLFVNPRDNAADGQDNDGNGYADDVSGWDFVDDDSDPNDEDGHGTHVAGIAGAKGNNGSGAVGVNWGVKLLPLRAGDIDALRTSAINDSLAYVRQLKSAGINIVATNNSYGSGSPSQSTRDEISRHEQAGILFVAAAGNDGQNMDASLDALSFPAGYTLDNIISVANSNQEDSLSGSSNYGAVSVDLAAPGSNIYATYPVNTYAFLSGTSMASPMVAGAVGLLAQAEPNLTAAQIKERLLQTGDPLRSGSGATVTGKRLNLLAALRPELSGHDISVSNVDDFMVLFESAEGDAVFEIAAHPDAQVSASVVLGPEVGAVEPLGTRSFRFVPAGNGQAKLRFVSTLQGISKSVEKTVFVGRKSPVQNGLIHHYEFGGTGSVVTDLAGSSNGSLVGATREESAYGSSLRLDSVNEKVSFNGSFSGAVTIAALVRSDDLRVSPHPRIVNMPFYYLYFSTGEGLVAPDGNRDTLKFFSYFDLDPANPDPQQPDIGVWNAPPRSIEDGQWYYVVGTYNSGSAANTPSLYINGERQAATVQNEPRGSIVSAVGESFIGNNGANSRAFDGLMADVRIYNRVLSAVEVNDLGAALVQDKWASVQLIGPAEVRLGAAVEFVAVDGSDMGSGLEVDWHLEGSSGLEVVSSSGAVAQLRFNEMGTVRLVGQVSDGLTTRILVSDVRVIDGNVTAGRYHGTTSSGGVVWLEVDPGLESGFISLFDLESGFYRIREPITIDENGTFRTAEDSLGAISGIALSTFSGIVPGFGVEFSGQYQPSSGVVSPYQGDYVGGSIGVGGDALSIEILDDGRAYARRSGPVVDLGLGLVDEAGQLLFTSARGLPVSLLMSPDSGVVTGDWGSGRAFLKRSGEATLSTLKGGLVGGRTSGSGVMGLYSEFEGSPSGSGLATGGYARGELAPDASGPFVLLGPDGRAHFVRQSPGQGIVDAVRDLIQQRAIPLDSNAVDVVRAQAPIFEGAVSMIAFSIVGSEPSEVLLRGLGPSFSGLGAEDPLIRLYQLSEAEWGELSMNDDWAESSRFFGEGESGQEVYRGLQEAFEALQLEPLERGAADAAQRLWLEPGDYLLVVERAAGAGGVGLIELFAL